LIELREAVLGRGIERERADAVVAEHSEAFVLERRATHRERHTLDASQLADLLTGTYRGARRRAQQAELGVMTVTLAAQVLVFSRRPHPGSSC
jgi:hypothetical protein